MNCCGMIVYIGHTNQIPMFPPSQYTPRVEHKVT